MNELDRNIFLLINGSGESIWVGFLAYLMAKYIIFAVPIGMVLLWVVGGFSEKRRAMMLFFAISIAIILSFIIGQFFPAPRPFLVPLGHVLMEHRPSPSFPSNHGLVVFTSTWVLLFTERKWQAAVFGMGGVLVAWSRIYLGIHWPSDMIGALLVSAIAAYCSVLCDHFFGGPVTLIALQVYERLKKFFTDSAHW